MEQIDSLVRQLQTLRTFYNLSLTTIVERSGVSIATASKALSGSYYGLQLHNFIALAEAMNTDVVLKPRDPRFIEHLKSLLPDFPIEKAQDVASLDANLQQGQPGAE